MFAVGISRAKQGTLDIVNHLGAKALAEIGLVGRRRRSPVQSFMDRQAYQGPADHPG